MPKVSIYHIEGRRSERVVWLMEELGMPYELHFKPGDLGASMAMAKKIHPMGIVPTVVVDGHVMVESGAILEYIITKWANGRLWVPVNSPDYADHLMWMHYAEGSAATRIVQDFWAHDVAAGGSTSTFVKLGYGDTARVLDMVEAHLSQHPYFGGQNFSAADMMMHFPLRLTQTWGVDWSLYPHIGPWFAKVEARPAFKQMLAKALPNGPLANSALRKPYLADTGKKPAK